MIAAGACVIGGGLTWEGKRVISDVDERCAEVAGWVTPRLGGVGVTTVAMLLRNTVTAAEVSFGLRSPPYTVVMTKVSDLLAAGRTYSFEFFPPKNDAEQARLVQTRCWTCSHCGPPLSRSRTGAGRRHASGRPTSSFRCCA